MKPISRIVISFQPKENIINNNLIIPQIEIFIRMSEHKIEDLEKLFGEVKENLSKWKKENSFETPINLKIIPMKGKFEVNI
ncbi:hypothetical protein AUJ61_03600 [Candidatus Pacearchaeota archaeon CG1_02_30_18]|nr:MAG: hypothetical protein AUJ61_03600 [Candidatus Pacearchaeota archaeon CG1_02_30_18]PIN71742.1 MAG: hypothetical protein COV77_00555 [Candidatus Pacearchaeota archaeon CG11_big_fil_rev_8_21_14_0_20_30_13]